MFPNEGLGMRVVNFVTSKNLIVKSTMFLHHNINKFTWTSDGKTYNQIDHILTDTRWHSGQQIVILTTIWWWQKLGRDWQ
jgi:hypothetical protein